MSEQVDIDLRKVLAQHEILNRDRRIGKSSAQPPRRLDASSMERSDEIWVSPLDEQPLKAGPP